jgi:hypothetical protein
MKSSLKPKLKFCSDRLSPLIRLYLKNAMSLPINNETMSINRILKDMSRLSTDASITEKIKQIEYIITTYHLV